MIMRKREALYLLDEMFSYLDIRSEMEATIIFHESYGHNRLEIPRTTQVFKVYDEGMNALTERLVFWKKLIQERTRRLKRGDE
jgi:hypothetical protein